MSYRINNGVRFSDSLYDWSKSVHSFRNLGMYFANKTIGSPEPFVFQVEVPGRDGLLDVTEDFYPVTSYKNRTLKIVLVSLEAEKNWAGIYSKVATSLHGMKKYVRFDDDKNYAYFGRVTIDTFATNRHKGEITLSVDCEPYKTEVRAHDDAVTVGGSLMNAWLWDELDFFDGYIYDSFYEVSGTKTVPLHHVGKRVKYSFSANANMTLTYKGEQFVVNGDNQWHESSFYVVDGDENITISGNGTLKMKWRGGVL